MKNTSIFLIVLLIAFCLGAVGVFGAAKTWVGNTTDWGLASNWNPAILPSSSDDITIPTTPTGGNMPTLSSGSYTIHNLTISSGATLTISGGTLEVNDIKDAGFFTMAAGLLKVGHDYKPTTPANFDCSGGGTVEFTGSAGNGSFQNAGTYKFNNVIIDASGVFIKSDKTAAYASSILSISGNLNIMTGGVLNLPNNSNHTANSLQFNGVNQSNGDWGSSTGGSGATYTSDAYFGITSSGVITANTSLPVELTSFSANISEGNVNLQWNTATEVNNYGFEVHRSINADNWELVGFVEGYGNSNSSKNYSFIDSKVNSEGKYFYRLKQIDNDGTFEYSDIIEISFTSPINFELSQNYPNPFNPSTTINFSLPEADNISIKIFNPIGEEVATLINGYTEPGVHTVTFNADNLPSGLYIYRLDTNESSLTKKMLFMK